MEAYYVVSCIGDCRDMMRYQKEKPTKKELKYCPKCHSISLEVYREWWCCDEWVGNKEDDYCDNCGKKVPCALPYYKQT